MSLRAAAAAVASSGVPLTLRRVRPSTAAPLLHLLHSPPPPHTHTTLHHLSTAARPRGAAARSQRRRGGAGPSPARREAQEEEESPQQPPTHPPLQQTLRKFYLRVHPDLFTHHPTQKHVNQESFSRFQAFLDEVRDQTTAPPRAGLHAYRFYLKTKEEGKFQEVALELRTTGGDCRNVVQRSLEGFFKQCGLPERFTWAESDWVYSIERMSEEERKRQEEEGY